MKNQKFKYFFLLFSILPFCYSYSQWSTSTRTDSALWVGTGGFNASAVTYDDGSIIICSGPWSTINLLKLDAKGYRVWPNIVTAHYNDSTDTEGGASIISDGAGGAIALWGDHRGAFQDSVEGEYFNNAIYIQRVDSSGVVRWAPGGVLVAPPPNGKKFGSFTSDGAGGTIISWVEYGVNTPNPTGLSALKASRYNADGQKLWEVTLDSMYDTLYWARRITFQNIVRAGRYVYVDYIKWPISSSEIYITRIIDTSGVAPADSVWYGYSLNTSWKDSVLYNFSASQMSKISSDGTKLWSTPFVRPTGCQPGWIYWYTLFVPDQHGGVYLMYVCNDSVYRFFDTGEYVAIRCLNISSFLDTVPGLGGHAFSDGQGGIVLANTKGKARRYDSLGTPLWGTSPIVYQSDPQNAYFHTFWPDNNGGIIVLFWNGGIYAIHTGRYGKVGVVPVLEESFGFPQVFELRQNYPNPFNSSTKIQFTLPRKANITLSLYDVLGRLLEHLVNEELPMGIYTINFDGSFYSSGMYFMTLQTDRSPPLTRKLLLLR